MFKLLQKYSSLLASIFLIIIIFIPVLYLGSVNQPVLNPVEVSKKISIGTTLQPELELPKTDNTKFQVIYWTWTPETDDKLSDNLDKAISNKDIPIVMVEPYLYLEKSESIFNKIIEGNYLPAINNLCKLVDSKKTEVYLSFAHSMDINDKSVYPWANDDGPNYVLAYKYFQKKCKEKTSFAKYMWSPDGSGYIEQFYPGKDKVDLIGLGAFQTEAKNNLPFENLFDPKYTKAKQYKQPILIFKLAVEGGEDLKNKWIKNAQNRIYDVDLQRYLTGFVYFQTENTESKPSQPATIKPKQSKL
jgi:beta-mannanase